MRYLRDSFTLLKRGLAVLLLWPAPEFSSRPPSIGAAVLLLGLTTFVVIVANWLSVAYGPRAFTLLGVLPIGLALIPIIAVSWIASRRLQNMVPDSVGQIFLTLVAAFAVYLSMRLALDAMNVNLRVSRRIAQSSRLVLMLWFVIAASVYLFKVTQLAQWIAQDFRQTIVSLFFPLVIAFSPYVMQHRTFSGFWIDLNEPVLELNLASERVLNAQALMFTQQLGLLKEQRKGVIDTYFIGYAPDATQDVFKRELETIHPLMDSRFDTKGRSLRMVNHSSTLSTYPIATQTYFKVAIEQMAALMDKDEDLLVLYFTSHGSREHELVPRFAPMELEPITPDGLKRILDISGIKNRVIIVSACYSGGFIAPLKGPDTLVMTASAKDRTSFGCSNESDFTYFGKALFDEQLRKTRSYEEAFRNALPVIAEREKKITDTLSNPQISVGENVSKLLKRVEAQNSGKTQ